MYPLQQRKRRRAGGDALRIRRLITTQVLESIDYVYLSHAKSCVLCCLSAANSLMWNNVDVNCLIEC